MVIMDQIESDIIVVRKWIKELDRDYDIPTGPISRIINCLKQTSAALDKRLTNEIPSKDIMEFILD